MTSSEGSATEPAFTHVLTCPCGAILKGRGEDDIVAVAFAHLREQHPDMADHYEPDDILAMALPVGA